MNFTFTEAALNYIYIKLDNNDIKLYDIIID